MAKGRRMSAHPGVDAAVSRARSAFEALNELSLGLRYAMIAAMREAAKAHIKELSLEAVDETGLGRAEDKVKKNLLVTLKTPGPEILEPKAKSGDHGLMLMERAPHGVIGAIIPTTNPTETVINNAIAMVSGGNAVVFNAHPNAKRCSNHCAAILNDAVVSVGGPNGLIACVDDPSIESAQALMQHPGVALLCVTGGPGVVHEAMKSGKKVIAAGPGNPPAVVDETADIALAARNIVLGASLDNNIICTSEKEVVVVASVADELKRAMLAEDCIELTGADIERLCAVIFESRQGRHGVINKKFIGKNACVILHELGIQATPATRLVLCEVDRDHPLLWTEQLMPVLPIVRAANVDEAIGLAVQFEGGRRHTATMHSRNIEKLSKMARLINCSIFVKNGATPAGLGMGGEGYTSFTIASPTGEGMTTPISFTRERRCTLAPPKKESAPNSSRLPKLPFFP
ncbi:MAG: aldehyde dehydrogenase EutE [Candidatus Hydrogenedentes bacterium]|nr:aldehyde dehydrogenase EutE [Candidatus Hydrogenedentota bacterium]